MIKIKPYTELTNKDEFFNLYLYMVAKAVPFYPEDIFYEGYYYENGITQKDVSEYDRNAKRRTDNYIKLLSDYGITEEKSKSTQKIKQENDAKLAQKMIEKYSSDLHKFLYEGCKDGHVDPKKLRELLTTSVSETGLKKIGFSITDFPADDSNNTVRQQLLKYVFRYEDSFSKKIEKDDIQAKNKAEIDDNIFRLVEMLGVSVCPYCNRLFTTTVSKSGKTVRPQLDHYRDKSDYPFLALSIMNLVPSCGVCNLIKSNKKDEVLYPYEEEMGDNCTFYVEPNDDYTALTGAKRFNKTEIKLKFVGNGTKEERVKNSVNIFKLEDLYNSHTDIVSDLLLNRYICTDKMIDDIYENFRELFQNRQEVREALLMGKLDKERLGERPLGKLIHDISSQLDKEYAKIKLIGLLNKKE